MNTLTPVVSHDTPNVLETNKHPRGQFKVPCQNWNIDKIAETFIQIFFDVFNQHRDIDREKNENELRIMEDLKRDKTAICGYDFVKMRIWGLEPCVILDANGETVCVIESQPLLGIKSTKVLSNHNKTLLGTYCENVSSAIRGLTTLEVNTSTESNFWKCEYFPYWFAFHFSRSDFVKDETINLVDAKVIVCKKTITEIREIWAKNETIFYRKLPPWDGYGLWGIFRDAKFNTEVSYEFLDFCDLFLDRQDTLYTFTQRIFPRGLFTALA